jgi:hypothetical protein
MYRKILIGGVTAAAIVGTGGAALALSGSNPTGGTPVTTAAATQQHRPVQRLLRGHKGKLLRRVAHGEVVVRGKDGFVTHDLIVGKVTAVSSDSITVKAADNTSETYAVGKDTKVRMRTIGSGGAASSIDKVATGDEVLVAGTGTSTLTAKHVVDVKH